MLPFHRLMLVAVGLIALVAASTAADSANRDEALFRVMSYNVRNSRAKDGDDAWALRKEIFFEPITRFAPTLIGFQEVLADQHDEIVAQIKDYGFSGVARDDGKRKGEWSLIGY